MKKKTKSIIAGGAVALGVASTALFGLNTTENPVIMPDNAITTDSTAVTTADNEAQTETAENKIEDENVTADINYTASDEETTDSAPDNDNDPLKPYRKVIEKDGVLIYYYENVPNELKPLLINNPYAVYTLNSNTAVTVAQSDISIVDNYIFVQTANGLVYLSQITHGITTDERITNNTFLGYTVYLNKTIECEDWLPFKAFAGTFFGNNNTIYVSSLASSAGLTIDNSFCETFTGTLSDLAIECNAPDVPFIKTAQNAKIEKSIFSGEVTYLIETAENTDITDCEMYITCNALIQTAKTAKITNTMLENNMTVGMIETACEGCKITDNIISSTITGDVDGRCGAFVGTLKTEITIKNNISTCNITVPTGYGGHAIGYADYDYTATENIFGNYFDSYLTVEGTPSDLFIGNIDIYKITAALESLEKPLEMWQFATGYINGNVVTTVYNVSLIPKDFKEQWDSYNNKVTVLKEAKEKASSSYEGFYNTVDIAAVNEDNKTPIYEENGKYYFTKEELPETLVIKNAVYSNGDVIIFFNQPVTNKTAIVTAYKDNRMTGVYYENITGETVFIDTQKPEEITSVAIMVWDSMASMTPLCPKYETEVKQ